MRTVVPPAASPHFIAAAQLVPLLIFDATAAIVLPRLARAALDHVHPHGNAICRTLEGVKRNGRPGCRSACLIICADVLGVLIRRISLGLDHGAPER